MKLCAIIPARFGSKRLPGKPLLKINNQEMLLLTYNSIKRVVKEKDIYVFTDAKKIKNQLSKKIRNIILFGGKFKNGTERVSFGLKKIKKKYSASLIVSCDNPFINQKPLKKTIFNYKLIERDKEYCGSTVHLINNKIKVLKNRNIAKVVLNKKNEILYLTRSSIPFNLIKKKYFFTHHGPVCIKFHLLKKYYFMKNTPLQLAEDNEWMKYIENGYKIKSSLIKKMPIEINTLKELKYYRSISRKND